MQSYAGRLPAWRALAGWVAERQAWFVLVAALPLILPEYVGPLVPLAWALLTALLLCRLASAQRWWPGAALGLPLLGLLVMLPVSLWASSNPALSWPKLTSIVAGLFLFWTLALGVRRQDLPGAALVLALAGGGLSLVALVGAEWPKTKILGLAAVYDRLPHLIGHVERSTRGGFHANEVGGALAMLIPLLLAVLLLAWRQAKTTVPLSFSVLLPPRLRHPALAGATLSLLMLGALLALATVILVLTQSRGSLAGLLAGLLVMAIARDRRAAVVAVLLAAVLGLWLLAAGGGNVLAALSGGGDPAEVLGAVDSVSRVNDRAYATGPARAEMWGNALRLLRDYPLTGAGLNTFPAVTWANYEYRVVGMRFNMNHAHNAYLQAGADFGLPGLAAYLLLLAAVVWYGARAAVVWRGDPLHWLACGLLGGVTVSLVHSLVDATARPLGAKPGILFWALAGLLVALGGYGARGRPVLSPVQRRRLAAAGLAALTLVALAVVVGPLQPLARANMGAVALDKARLSTALTGAERSRLLDQAERCLSLSLPWNAQATYVRLGLLHSGRGQDEQALAMWQRTPLALPYLQAQGEARQEVGDAPGAQWYLQRAAGLGR